MPPQQEKCVDCRDNNDLLGLIRSQSYLKTVRIIGLVVGSVMPIGALIAQRYDVAIWISLGPLATSLVVEIVYRIVLQIAATNRFFLSLDKEGRMHVHHHEPQLTPPAVPCRFWQESMHGTARVVERSYLGAIIEIKASLWWNLRCHIHAHQGNSWRARIRGRKLLLYDAQDYCLSISLTKREVKQDDDGISLVTKEVIRENEIKWALGVINTVSSLVDLQLPQVDQEKPAVAGLIGQA
jgi:hypothetical protein